jgi:hypothetical protein
MPAQCTSDRLLTNLHVSFGEDITTHLIPVPNNDEKAALYYSLRDLKAFRLAGKLRKQSFTRFSLSVSTTSAQCTSTRPLTSRHVSFGEVITTHLVPPPNDDDKAALYYSRRELKVFKLAHKLRTQKKIAKIMKFFRNKHALDKINERVQAMQCRTIESFYIAARFALEDLTCCSKTKDGDITWRRLR